MKWRSFNPTSHGLFWVIPYIEGGAQCATLVSKYVQLMPKVWKFERWCIRLKVCLRDYDDISAQNNRKTEESMKLYNVLSNIDVTLKI